MTTLFSFPEILNEMENYKEKNSKFCKMQYNLINSEVEEMKRSKQFKLKNKKLWNFDFESNKNFSEYTIEAYNRRNSKKNYNIFFEDNYFRIETFENICTLDVLTGNIIEIQYKRNHPSLLQKKKVLLDAFWNKPISTIISNNKYDFTIRNIESLMNMKCNEIYHKLLDNIKEIDINLSQLQDFYEYVTFRQAMDHIIGERIIDNTLVYTIKITEAFFSLTNSDYTSTINRKNNSVSFEKCF